MLRWRFGPGQVKVLDRVEGQALEILPCAALFGVLRKAMDKAKQETKAIPLRM